MSTVLYTAYPRRESNGKTVTAEEATERMRKVFSSLNLVLGVQAFSNTRAEVDANVLEPSHIIEIRLTDVDVSEDVSGEAA